MSLTRYRYFALVADHGSVREAADALRVAPSAISRQIAGLEEEYGTALFERRARGMRLTTAGAAVLETARTILDSVQTARSAIDELQGMKRGHVRVWTVEGAMDDFVYPALAEFSAAHPSVSFDIMVASSDQLVQRLLDDEAEVIVAFNPIQHRSVLSLAEIADALVLAAHPDDAIAQRQSVRIAEIGEMRLALPDRTFGLRRLVDDMVAAAGIELKPALVTNSIQSLRSFARASLGVSVLTRCATRRDVTEGRLVAVPLQGRNLRKACLKICVRNGRTLSPAARALARHLARSARGYAAGHV
ncbi:MAG TPA: LysR family transcriptional regulator [Bosea sp. (in: a-proteobacteria)]|jgi:DNA-binding transcriptional LysR family regulator|nr:LysR family transcriptional regulator [Bosea sp. (in: a-proteobacteria)]